MAEEVGATFLDFVVESAWKAGIAITPYGSRYYQFNRGETRTGVEIKFDGNFRETGQLYIETGEKRDPETGKTVLSGILRKDHWLYAVGDYETIFLFPSRLLRLLMKEKNYENFKNETMQGFFLPVGDAHKYAALVLRPKADPKLLDYAQKLSKEAQELLKAAQNDWRQLELQEYVRSSA